MCPGKFEAELPKPCPRALFQTPALPINLLAEFAPMRAARSVGGREVHIRDLPADKKVFRPPDPAQGGVGRARDLRRVQVDCDVVWLCALHLHDGAAVAGANRVVGKSAVLRVRPAPDLDQMPCPGPDSQALGSQVVAECPCEHSS